MSLSLDVTSSPDHADLSTLSNGLARHAEAAVGQDGFDSVAVFLRQDDGAVLGGISAYVNWDWLQISLLWVDDALRGQGYGTALVEAIEARGRERGCRYAHLSTFDFQAAAFYERLGYEVFASLDNYPAGHERRFLKKAL